MSDQKVDSALVEYLAECDELSQRISDQLRAIEKGLQTPETIDSLYRDIHTLKGSSQLFGFKQIGELVHAMETRLEPYRRDRTAVEAVLIDHLLKGLDIVDELIDSIKETGSEKSVSNAILSLITAMTAPEPGGPVEEKSETTGDIPQPEMKKEAAFVAESSDLSTSIRVPVTLLDRLMNLMGEMVLVRNQVLQFGNRIDDLEFLNLSQRLDVVTSEIQGEVMKTRMQPIGSVLSKFHRVARDLAKELGKKIELVLIGTETELDKTLLEAVRDPIMHIVRNSCDHGIELPDERVSAGKPAAGTITVRSFHEGGQVIVEITDDGRGLNREKLVAKAVEKGLLTPAKAALISERDAYALIFAPGFSTAAKVTNVSGRGVGMDVVKNNIESIGGIVEIHSAAGKGTTTRLKIPLTLAIVPAMIVRVGSERFAIPQVKLVELVRVEKGDESSAIESLQGKPVFRLRGNLLPLVTLRQILALGDADESENRDVTNIVILNAEGVLIGLIVDEVQDTAEVVVKPLSNFLKGLLLYSGATVLGDGSVALILDIVGIAQLQNLTDDGHEKSKAAIQMTSVLNESQEFLLFKLNAPTKHSIPLNLVHRLEEFNRREIEYSGQQRFVRYRDSALPITSLNTYLGFEPSKATDSISVIVTQKSGKFFGIEVDEIFDVLNTTAQMDDGFSDRSGIFGNLVTEDELIVVVDVLKILDDVSTSLSKGGGSAVVPIRDFSRGSGKILFAEDTSFFRRHVSTILERAGYHVTACENGSDALQILEKSATGDFDLILSDIEMPKMTGLELASAIRRNENWKRIPLVALTTKFSASHIEEGKRAGFDLYLEKLKSDALLSELDSILRSQKRGAS